MVFRVAVIGPQDLVDQSCLVAKDFKSIDLLRLPYESETQTGELVSRRDREVDGFLFTGFLPYFNVKSCGITRKPLFYYPILGESLYRTLLIMELHHGIDITRVSIDSLTKEQVSEAYGEIRLDSSMIRINDRQLAEFSFEQYVDFHRSAFRSGLTQAAITAVNSVQVRLLEEGVPAFKVVPTLNTIRRTFGIVEAARETLAAEAAQIVVQIVSIQEYSTDGASLSGLEKRQKRLDLHSYLMNYARKYQASLFAGAGEDDEFILFISKGMFREYTNEHADIPLASDIRSTLSMGVNVGIGMGRSAWEAEDNARGALLLARSRPGWNVCIMNQDKEIIGPLHNCRQNAPVDFSLKSENHLLVSLSERTGLSISTLTRVQGIMRGLGRDTTTASELREAMGVSLRTANRVLHRLSSAGLAVNAGVEQPFPRGRPRNVFRIRL